jgi:hypothetical protein
MGRRQGSVGPGWGCNKKAIVSHKDRESLIRLSFLDN